MKTKQKYFVRRGKRGVLYLQERHCGLKLGDCLHTTDEKIAEVRRREIHISIERGDYQNRKLKFAEVASGFFEDVTRGRSKNTVIAYRTAFHNHLVPWFGEALLCEIQQDDLLEYKRARESEGAGEVSLTHEMWLFRKLMKSKGVDIKPLSEAFMKPAVTIDRFPTEPEVLSIIDQTKGESKAIFLVLAYSGLRKMDCLTLKWSNFDFKSGFIKRRQKKTGKIVQVPLHEKLLDGLSMVPRGVGDTTIFKVSSRTLHSHWRMAKMKVGLDWIRIHDLRHFYASYLASNGVNREMIGAILGHRDLKSTARYAKFNDKAYHDAVSVFVPNSSANLRSGSGK